MMHKNTSLLYKKPTIGLWASRSFFYFKFAGRWMGAD